jgi:hypothetical protein
MAHYQGRERSWGKSTTTALISYLSLSLAAFAQLIMYIEKVSVSQEAASAVKRSSNIYERVTVNY